MIRLYRHRDRFIQCSEKALAQYNNSPIKDIAASAGTLNYIWNLWNSFWREFFMLYAIGGYDCRKNRVHGFVSSDLNQSQVAAFYLSVRRGTSYRGQSISYYSELTWGDPSVISILLSSPLVSIVSGGYINTMLSLFSTDIKDFQDIRNSFIHMNSFGLSFLERNVLPRYLIPSNMKVINILEGISLRTNRQCLNELVDSMSGCLLNLI